MILDRLGKMEAGALALVAGAVDSTNVIQVAALDFAHPTDLWWVVDTHTAAGGGTSSTYQFQLILSQESTLDTNIQILSRTVTGAASACIATAGKHIIACNVGKMIKDLMGEAGSDYAYIGMIITLADGNGTATLKVNGALSNSEPQTEYAAQVVDSNVSVPAAASAGS